MKTIARNTKKFKQVLDNASSIISYSLNNNFSGREIQSIDEYARNNGRMVQKSETEFSLNLHSNHWYEIKVAA